MASHSLFVWKTSLLIFFHGSNETEISLDGVDRVIFISLRSKNGEDAVVAPSDDCVGTKPQSKEGNAVICFRHYAVSKTQTAVSKTSDPSKVKLVDIGPNYDFEIRRVFFSSPADFKQASKLPKEALAHLKAMHENVKTDALGNLTGQLHVGKQNMAELNLRRFSAQKKSRRVAEQSDDVELDEPSKKRKRNRKVQDEDNEVTDI